MLRSAKGNAPRGVPPKAGGPSAKSPQIRSKPKAKGRRDAADPEPPADGNCGFHGCDLPIDPTTVTENEPVARACAPHFTTFVTGYDYERLHTVQDNYREQPPFAKCFDQAHQVVHGNADKVCKEGSVAEVAENVRECGRDYGGYNLTDRVG